MVEFIYRCGDITSSSNGTLSKEAMNAGSKMHRKLQKMAGSYYDAEVPLKITMKKGIHDLDVTVEGRADGIIDLRGEKTRTFDQNADFYITVCKNDFSRIRTQHSRNNS